MHRGHPVSAADARWPAGPWSGSHWILSLLTLSSFLLPPTCSPLSGRWKMMKNVHQIVFIQTKSRRSSYFLSLRESGWQQKFKKVEVLHCCAGGKSKTLSREEEQGWWPWDFLSAAWATHFPLSLLSLTLLQSKKGFSPSPRGTLGSLITKGMRREEGEIFQQTAAGASPSHVSLF